MSQERNERAGNEPIDGPSPRFVAELRGRLLAEARQMEANHSGATVDVVVGAVRRGRPVSGIGRPRRAAPARSREARTAQSSPARERFATAFLVLVIVLAVAGAGARDRGWFGESNPALPGARSAIQAVSTPHPVAMEDGNAAHTGVFPGTGPVGAAAVAWRLTVPSVSGPIVAGDRLYYLSATAEGQQVIAADLATGATRWSVPVTLPVFYATPAIANGLVYLPTPKGVIALDAETGATVWTADLGTGSNSPSITVADGLAYVTAHDKTLRALDAATGRERWRTTIHDSTRADAKKMEILANTFPVTVADGVAYTFGNGGLLLASDVRTGQMMWSFETGSDSPVRAPMAADGTVVVSAAIGGEPAVQAIDAATGSLRWQQTGEEAGYPVAIDQGVLYLGHTGPDGAQLAAVRLDAGIPALWTLQTSGRNGGFGLANGVLYVVIGGNATVEGIDVASHASVLSVSLGTAGSVAMGGGLLVATTVDGLVAIAATPTTGTPTVATTPVDLSGLPACIQPRDPQTGAPAGTPAATLNAESRVMGSAVPGTIAQILTANLPTGAPASTGEIAGIQETLDRLDDCVIGRADSPDIGGFFTDDFYRRGWGAGAGEGANIGDGPSWPIARSTSGSTIEQTITLADGRIAAVIDFGIGPNIKLLVIFNQVSGSWLIDEWYTVVPEYREPMG